MNRSLSLLLFALLAVSWLPHTAHAQCDAPIVWHAWGVPTVLKVRNNIAYRGYPAHIQITDLTNPTAPIDLGHLTIDGEPKAMHLNGSYLYVAAGEAGLLIVDISNTAAPTLIATVPLVTANDIAVSNGLAFVLSVSDLHIYDVATPAAPVFKSVYPLPILAPQTVVSSGYTVFVAHHFGVEAVDATNPISPVTLDTYPSLVSIVEDLAIRGNTLAVMGWNGVELLNVANPAAMTQYSFVANVSINDEIAIGVNSGTTLLHYQYDYDNIRTYDITNPATPLFRSDVVSTYLPLKDLAASGGNLYELASGTTHVHDFAVPASPTLTATILQGGFNPENILVVGPYTIFSSGDQVFAMDVTIPTAPGIPTLIHTAPQLIDDMSIKSNRLYVASGTYVSDSSLEVLDLTIPTAPALLGARSLPDGPVAMAVEGFRVFIVDESDNLSVFDATNPAAITSLGRVALPFPIHGYEFARIEVSGNHAFIAAPDGLTIIDIRDPAAPVVVGTRLPRGIEELVGFAMRDNIAFVAQSDDAVESFDLIDPLVPVLLDTITFPDEVSSIGVIDSLLLVTSFSQFDIVDTANPANLLIVESRNLDLAPDEFARRGDIIWGSAWVDGLFGITLPDFPRITNWPDAAVVCPGAPSVSFSVTVDNSAGALYLWRRNGSGIINGGAPGGATYSGANSNTLTILNPNPLLFANYSCVIIRPCLTTSTGPVSLSGARPPVFSQHPQAQATCLSGGATFEVADSATTPFTHRWQFESPPGSGTYVNFANGVFTRFTVSGATGRILSIAAAVGQTLPNALATNYRCIVTNSCGSATSNPAALSICVGDADCDADTDSDDVVTFFTAWDAGESGGDADGDGDTDSDDIIVFFAAWDAGC